MFIYRTKYFHKFHRRRNWTYSVNLMKIYYCETTNFSMILLIFKKWSHWIGFYSILMTVYVFEINIPWNENRIRKLLFIHSDLLNWKINKSERFVTFSRVNSCYILGTELERIFIVFQIWNITESTKLRNISKADMLIQGKRMHLYST